MLFTCYSVPACRQTVFMSFVAWFWMSFCAREAQSEAKGRSVTVHGMCAQKPRHPVPRQDHVMAVWRGQEAVGVVVSPTVRARPHRESCLFGDDVVDTTHLVWLVVAPIVWFL